MKLEWRLTKHNHADWTEAWVNGADDKNEFVLKRTLDRLWYVTTTYSEPFKVLAGPFDNAEEAKAAFVVVFNV